MDKVYKCLKIITAAAIYEAGDKGSNCFRQEFQAFLKWGHKYYTEPPNTQDQFYFFKEIFLPHLEEQFKKHPEWRDFLIAKSLIEQISEPKFYSVGDEFVGVNYPERIYKLIVVTDYTVLLILKNGRSFYGTPPIAVKNIGKITEEEFKLITRGDPHLFIKEENPK